MTSCKGKWEYNNYQSWGEGEKLEFVYFKFSLNADKKAYLISFESINERLKSSLSYVNVLNLQENFCNNDCRNLIRFLTRRSLTRNMQTRYQYVAQDQHGGWGTLTFRNSKNVSTIVKCVLIRMEIWISWYDRPQGRTRAWTGSSDINLPGWVCLWVSHVIPRVLESCSVVVFNCTHVVCSFLCL